MGKTTGTKNMNLPALDNARMETPVSERSLRQIVEQGFFGTGSSLAEARAACAELMFARELIKAQTIRIAQLDGGAEKR